MLTQIGGIQCNHLPHIILTACNCLYYSFHMSDCWTWHRKCSIDDVELVWLQGMCCAVHTQAVHTLQYVRHAWRITSMLTTASRIMSAPPAAKPFLPGSSSTDMRSPCMVAIGTAVSCVSMVVHAAINSATIWRSTTPRSQCRGVTSRLRMWMPGRLRPTDPSLRSPRKRDITSSLKPRHQRNQHLSYLQLWSLYPGMKRMRGGHPNLPVLTHWQ